MFEAVAARARMTAGIFIFAGMFLVVGIALEPQISLRKELGVCEPEERRFIASDVDKGYSG